MPTGSSPQPSTCPRTDRRLRCRGDRTIPFGDDAIPVHDVDEPDLLVGLLSVRRVGLVEEDEIVVLGVVIQFVDGDAVVLE
ncbi:hypothetical protein D8S78_22510 [Natrialba swarupiae]|nr:hypothetical protein [Natrialba swarupiae]